MKKRNPNSQNEEHVILLHPIPSMYSLTIENAIIGKELNIYSIIGDLILTEKAKAETLEIDISKLKPGVYILKGKELKIYKFIKL